MIKVNKKLFFIDEIIQSKKSINLNSYELAKEFENKKCIFNLYK